MRIIASIVLLSLTAAVHAADVEWRLPEWISIGADIEGSAVLMPPAEGPVHATCVLPGGATVEVDVAAMADERGRVAFRVPEVDEPGMLMLRLEWRAEGGDTYDAETTIPVGDSLEIEISGVAAEVLEFPLKGWPAEVLFVPCCNLNGGILQMLRYPENPVAGDGLPDSLLSEFIVALPDAMVRGTAGLSLVFSIPEDSDAVVYRWGDGAWEPARDVKTNATARTLTVACPNGGAFVLARGKP